MKKPLFVIFFIFSLNICVHAQDLQIAQSALSRPEVTAGEVSGGAAQNVKKFAFSYGAEINKNSPRGAAGGAALGFDFYLKNRFAMGINFTASGNRHKSNVLEPSVMLRYYILSMSDQYSGLFVQLDAGVSIASDEGKASVKILGGARGGYRFTFGKLFFLEPYIRAGYPFFIGAGATFGYRY